jgi:tetratricopeptide (TPR) repeat protein
MASNWEPKTLFDLAQRHWHKPIGLIFTVAAAILFEIALLNSVKAPVVVAVIVYLITAVFSIIFWFYSNRMPRTPNDKVGFVVCIHCPDEEEEKIIREDFVKTLRKLLKGGKVGRTFHFIEIPKHISQSINDIDDAHTLRSRTKSHFLIYGRVRLRVLGGKECHIIELDGIVSHKPLSKEISNKLAKEFGELFPRRLQISTENDLLSLNFTSDWTESVAKYIIGIASFCSSDINYAEHLYRDVEKKLQGIKTDFPIFAKLKERLPKRFSEIYIARSKAYLNAWRDNNDKESLSQFIFNLNKISDDLADSYDVLLLRSVEAFLDGRRIKDAIENTMKCKRFDDPIWHFNLAFLRAYENDLKKSIRQYRICVNYDVAPVTLSEVEAFIVWILEAEPDKYQFHYCLGFFNWKIKGDLHQAVHDFKEFLKYIKNGEFDKERALALKWISEIEKEIVEHNA